MPLSPGTRLGPFEIVAPITLTGLGELYRARDHEQHRDVTMRVLAADFAGDPARLKRFEEEARAAALLSHPNILTIHDIGTDPRTAYVISEPIEGTTLRDALQAGALPVRTVVQYAAQIARGLGAAHQKRVAHRDLKPENLLVGADGRIRIIGFGLAAITQVESALAGLKGSAPGVGLGTPGYMSPEQVKGAPPDARSDMFTFGAIVYEMLTGTRTFSGDTPLETMTAVAKSEPKLPAHLELPPVLARMLELCLRKSPGSRPAAEDLAMALDALAQQPSGPPAPVVSRPPIAAVPPAPVVPKPPATPAPPPQTPPSTPAPVRPVAPMPEPVLAPPPSSAAAPPAPVPVAAGDRPVFRETQVRAPRRRLVSIVAALAVLGLLVAFGPGALRSLQRGGRQEAVSTPVQPAPVAVPVPVPPPPDPSHSRLRWFDRTGKEIGAVGDPADYGDVSLSPDGTRIAVSVRPAGSVDADIVLIDVESGMQAPLTSDPANDTAPVWSPDGRRVLFASARKGSNDIYQKNASGTGNEVAIVTAEGDQIAADWSSDGKYLLYQTNQPRVAAGGNFDLWARPLPNGRSFAYLRTIRAATRPKLSPDRRWVAYTSREGRDDVYVSRFPRPDGRRRISARGGSWPRWRRDGSELFYVDPGNRLMAVPIRRGSSLDAGPATALFQLHAEPDRGYAYDVSADGQRILVNSVGEAGPAQPATPAARPAGVRR